MAQGPRGACSERRCVAQSGRPEARFSPWCSPSRFRPDGGLALVFVREKHVLQANPRQQSPRRGWCACKRCWMMCRAEPKESRPRFLFGQKKKICIIYGMAWHGQQHNKERVLWRLWEAKLGAPMETTRKVKISFGSVANCTRGFTMTMADWRCAYKACGVLSISYSRTSSAGSD
jgi:hypothetical protein